MGNNILIEVKKQKLENKGSPVSEVWRFTVNGRPIDFVIFLNPNHAGVWAHPMFNDFYQGLQYDTRDSALLAIEKSIRGWLIEDQHDENFARAIANDKTLANFKDDLRKRAGYTRNVRKNAEE